MLFYRLLPKRPLIISGNQRNFRDFCGVTVAKDGGRKKIFDYSPDGNGIPLVAWQGDEGIQWTAGSVVEQNENLFAS